MRTLYEEHLCEKGWSSAGKSLKHLSSHLASKSAIIGQWFVDYEQQIP